MTNTVLRLLLAQSCTVLLLAASTARADGAKESANHTLDTLITNDRELIEQPRGQQLRTCRWRILAEGDIFRAYQQELSRYSTDLERENFRRSPEYEQYVQRARDELSSATRGTYLLKVADRLSEYDVQRSAFKITLGEATRRSDGPGNAATVACLWIGGPVEHTSSADRSLGHPVMGPSVPVGGWRIARLTVPQDVATELEPRRHSVDVYIEFSPSNEIRTHTPRGEFRWAVSKYLVAKVTRFYIVDRESRRILFDGAY